jgi:hypothetical protein
MSNEALKPDIYTLQQSVVDVLSQVRDLMNESSQKLDEERRFAGYDEKMKIRLLRLKIYS